jgi:hypothetical protein
LTNRETDLSRGKSSRVMIDKVASNQAQDMMDQVMLTTPQPKLSYIRSDHTTSHQVILYHVTERECTSDSLEEGVGGVEVVGHGEVRQVAQTVP